MKKLRSDNTIGYRGVSKKGNRFQATIKIGGSDHYIGYFGTTKEAAIAFDLATSILILVAERYMWGSQGHCAILVTMHCILGIPAYQVLVLVPGTSTAVFRCFQHGRSLSKTCFFGRFFITFSDRA